MLLSFFSSKRQKVFFALVVFFIAWGWQIIDINAEGRTWDEEYKVSTGYDALANLAKGDFSAKAWDTGTEHPMIAKYTYALAALPEIRTVVANQPINNGDDTAFYLATTRYYTYPNANNIYMLVNYDYTLPRLLSASFNAITISLVFLLATTFLNPISAFFIAGVLLTTPRFFAMGRLITFESLSDALYALTIFAFGYLLTRKGNSIRWYMLVGLLSGLLLWTRYNNMYIFFFLAGWWFLSHYISAKDKLRFLLNTNLYRWQLVLIPFTALLVGFATWPFLWMNFPTNFLHTFLQNEYRVTPFSLYYFIYLYYTTPLPYLILFVIGFFYAIKKHTYYHLIILWSLFSMAIFYTIFCAQTGGTRYIFSIYIPYALLCGVGLYVTSQWLYQKLKKGNLINIQTLLGIGILLYVLEFAIFQIHPYYLDYYNELAGGLPGAAQKGLSISWWGEGQREAGLWLDDHAPANSTVAEKVIPEYVFPPLLNNITVYPYNTHLQDADFLVVTRAYLNSSKNLLKGYQKIYSVSRQGVDLVTVFRKL